MSTGTLTPRGRHHRTAVLALPAAPDGQENAWHPRSAAGRLAPVALAASACCLAAAQAWLELHDRRLLALFGWYTVLFTASLVVSLPVLLARRPFSEARHVTKARHVTDARHSWSARSSRPATYPDVDIFLPVCGEPADLLNNPFAGVAGLVGAYPGRARPFVLDDGPADGARRLAAEYGFAYLRRPDRRQHGKAGNLNHALSRTVSPFVAVLHADARPRDDFLAAILPCFADPAVGIVQAPLFFQAPSGRSRPGQALLAARSATPLARVTSVARRVTSVVRTATQSSRDRLAAAQCTGSAVRPLPLVQRCRVCLAGWNSSLAVAWLALACWRSGQAGTWLTAVLALAGLCYLCLIVRLVAELRPSSRLGPVSSGGRGG